MDETTLVNKLIEHIENNLPSRKYFTNDAYNRLVDDVMEEVIGEKVQEAVCNAKAKLEWDDEFEVYR